MDKSGVPELAELYRGVSIDTRKQVANKHLKLAFPKSKVWLQLRDYTFGKRRARKKKCYKTNHAKCERNTCRNGYELTKVDVMDVLYVYVNEVLIGSSEKGFDEKCIAHIPAFNRFVDVLNTKLDT